MGWRYFAERLNGDGTATRLGDIPLSNVSITDTLSGPSEITGTIVPEWASMKGPDGRPILEHWSTAIYAEASGEIRAGGILMRPRFVGPEFEVNCMGFAGYPAQQPYTDSQFWINVDPLSLVRHIWQHLQSQPRGNIGMVVDSTTSPVRIGSELQQGEFDTASGPLSFEVGPYRLAWYETEDLGQEIDDLAESTPFDYREVHSWNADRSAVVHRLQLGYPRLGRRRHDLRFMLGENIVTMPVIEDNGDEYANDILLLGAGEGRTMVRGRAVQNDFRLRRATVVTDKAANTTARANSGASKTLKQRLNVTQLTDFRVRDHENAKIGAWAPGDEILVEGDTGWRKFKSWVRVVAIRISPEEGDIAEITTVPVEGA